MLPGAPLFTAPSALPANQPKRPDAARRQAIVNLGSSWLGGGEPGAKALGLDYPTLVASLAAAQATTRAATLDPASRPPFSVEDQVRALVTLFAAQPGWATSVAALGGSFNPAIAEKLS